MLGSPLAAPQPRRPRRRRASSIVPSRKTPGLDAFPSKTLVFSTPFAQQDDSQIPKSPPPKDSEVKMIELYSPSKTLPSADVLDELCRITRPPHYSNRPRQRLPLLKSPRQPSPSRKASTVDLADLVSATHLDGCTQSPQQGWGITLPSPISRNETKNPFGRELIETRGFGHFSDACDNDQCSTPTTFKKSQNTGAFVPVDDYNKTWTPKNVSHCS